MQQGDKWDELCDCIGSILVHSDEIFENFKPEFNSQ
jgi:hypothetical protein